MKWAFKQNYKSLSNPASTVVNFEFRRLQQIFFYTGLNSIGKKMFEARHTLFTIYQFLKKKILSVFTTVDRQNQRRGGVRKNFSS
jgi:hypothetical protein